MEDMPMEVERLLAALVMDAGGEIRVSYDALVKAHENVDRYLVMDIVDGGSRLAISIAEAEEVPDDIKQR